MTVFVLTHGFDYEGEGPVGVMASVELAKSVAETEAAKRGYENGQWETLRDLSLKLEFGSTYWIVRQEHVQGAAA